MRGIWSGLGGLKAVTDGFKIPELRRERCENVRFVSPFLAPTEQSRVKDRQIEAKSVPSVLIIVAVETAKVQS
jgi:hypothetical protein